MVRMCVPLLALTLVACTGVGSPRPSPTTAVPTATISGVFQAVGGPPPGGPQPLGGVVTAHGTGLTFTAAVGLNGRFTISVLPGTYKLTGRSPQFDNGTTACEGDEVTARVGTITTAVIDCAVP